MLLYLLAYQSFQFFQSDPCCFLKANSLAMYKQIIAVDTEPDLADIILSLQVVHFLPHHHYCPGYLFIDMQKFEHFVADVVNRTLESALFNAFQKVGEFLFSCQDRRATGAC